VGHPYSLIVNNAVLDGKGKYNMNVSRIRGHMGYRRTHLRKLFLFARLAVNNLTSSRTVISEHGDTVVSITTHGHRLDTVAIAIESIGSGTIKPRRMILWLEEPEFVLPRPANLQRLVRRGLEIRISNSYGPHCKYYSYVLESGDAKLPLVLADDDCLYPKWWLETLLASYVNDSDSVNCFRARVVMMTRENGVWQISPYSSWPLCNSSEPNFLTFATATKGVIYPPAMFEHIRNAGDRFLSCAPFSNDIWLHHLALRAGIPTRQIHSHQIWIPTIPRTQDIALYLTVNAQYKDRQIADTYGHEDVASLASELASM
jgi:hypothetical protein